MPMELFNEAYSSTPLEQLITVYGVRVFADRLTNRWEGAAIHVLNAGAGYVVHENFKPTLK